MKKIKINGKIFYAYGLKDWIFLSCQLFVILSVDSI